MKVPTFDPLWQSRLLSRYRDASAITIVCFSIGAVAVVLAGAAADGLLGSFSDIQFLSDVKRALRSGNVSPAAPRFPFFRDAVSGYLLVMSVATFFIARFQWRWMTNCIPALSLAGSLALKPQPRTRSRAMGALLNRGLDFSAPAPDILAKALSHTQRMIRWSERLWPVALALAAAAAVFLILGERPGVFHLLAPPGLHDQGREVWIKKSYDNWWASVKHPTGVLAYGAIATLAFTVMLYQNVVGVMCMYMVLVLWHVCDFRIDFLDRDGYSGWAPVGAIYRSAVLSLLLHLAAITSVVVVIGVDHIYFLGILVLVWCCVFPLYAIVPLVVFGRFGRRERERRIQELTEQATGRGSTPEELEAAQTIRHEIAEIRKARTAPFVPKIRDVPIWVVGIVIPVVLTVIQILASTRQ